MTDLVYDYISMGVDMILTAAILAAVVILLRTSVVLSSYQSSLQANSERMNYYRKFNLYDCTTNLCMADVQSALIYYRWELEITVDLGEDELITTNPQTGTYTYRNGTHIEEITADDFSKYMTAENQFSSKLVEDKSNHTSDDGYKGGMVTGILFKREVTSP